jgi:hypothetical protein
MYVHQADLSSINVDYIHINALVGYSEHLLIDVVDDATKYTQITTIDKISFAAAKKSKYSCI